MSDTLALLREIQIIDSEIDAIGRELESRSVASGTLKTELEKIKKEGEALKAELSSLEGKKAVAEEGARTSKERIDKDKKRINEIKNDKQYKAVTKELSDAEKALKLFEMELSAVDEKIGEKRKQVSTNEGAQKEKQDAISALDAETEKKKVEAETAISGKKEKRNSVASKVNPQQLKKYDAIRSKRAGIGIVAVKKEICQGCNIHIPPQTALELRKHPHEIMSCPHCHRILYIDDNKAETAQGA